MFGSHAEAAKQRFTCAGGGEEGNREGSQSFPPAGAAASTPTRASLGSPVGTTVKRSEAAVRYRGMLRRGQRGIGACCGKDSEAEAISVG